MVKEKMNQGTNRPLKKETTIKVSQRSSKQFSESFYLIFILDFSELDLDALSNEDYFEKKK
jgi:hypothetical protein